MSERVWLKPELNFAINSRILLTVSFLKTVMTKSICIWVFMIALPMKVAEKNFLKGILKWPQVMPAKSNKGLGIEAHRRIVMKPYFSILSKIRILALSMKVLLGCDFSFCISSIY